MVHYIRSSSILQSHKVQPAINQVSKDAYSTVEHRSLDVCQPSDGCYIGWINYENAKNEQKVPQDREGCFVVKDLLIR